MHRLASCRFAVLSVHVLVILVLLPVETSAYLDPGAGSIVYQTMLALFLGAGFVFRHAIGRLVALVQRRGKESTDIQPDA